MKFPDIFITILGSSLVSSIIAFLSTQLTSNKSYQVKYITEERQNWRKNIKEKIAEFCSLEQNKDSERRKIKTFMVLSLNPLDEEDNKIIDCMERYLADKKEADLKELEKRVALLLKHDWERAKKEVRIPFKDVDRSSFS